MGPTPNLFPIQQELIPQETPPSASQELTPLNKPELDIVRHILLVNLPKWAKSDSDMKRIAPMEFKEYDMPGFQAHRGEITGNPYLYDAVLDVVPCANSSMVCSMLEGNAIPFPPLLGAFGEQREMGGLLQNSQIKSLSILTVPKHLPPTVPMAGTYDKFIERYGSLDGWWKPENEKILLQPFSYLSEVNGKGIRTRLITSFNIWLNISLESAYSISRVVSALHEASLLLDDIEDNSELRRGRPAAHKVFGIPRTINSACLAGYCLIYKEIYSLRSQHPIVPGKSDKVELIFTDELTKLHRGQGMELFWRDTMTCPTEEDYIHMASYKTGGLFRLAVRLMAAKSASTIDTIPLVNIMSVYFQIRDDYMNLVSTEYETSKGFADDLTEGKFSFPIIHAIRTDPFNKEIINILKARTTDPELKHRAISYLKYQTKSFDYTLQVLGTLKKQITEEIHRLGGNEGLIAILESLKIV